MISSRFVTLPANLLDGYASAAQVRAHMATGEPFDTALWQAMVEQGWLSMEVPGAEGGLELGFVEVAVLLEQVGRHVAPAPFASTVLALDAVGDDPWRERLLDGGVGCVAYTESDRALVPFAPVAEIAVVATPDRVVMHDLRRNRPPAEPAMDPTRPLGWVAVDAPQGREVGGPAEAARVLDRGATATAAEILGASDRVLELSVEHAGTRVQFGKPIGSFQAVKHRCADMLVDVEGMRSTVYHAAWTLAARQPDASVAASTAKAWCADAGHRVTWSGLQVHGGIGFTWEHDLHLFMKRVQLDGVTFGDAQMHRRRLAALLRPIVAAGGSII